MWAECGFLVNDSTVVWGAMEAQAIMSKLVSFAGSFRDRFIVFAVFQSGILVSDLVALKVGDFPVEAWMGFETVSGRVGRCRFGVSTPETCACLVSYLEEREGQIGEPLLVGKNGSLSIKDVNKVLKGVIHRAGLDKIRGFTAKCMHKGFEATLKSPKIYLQVKEILLKNVI
jgi:site-specific recombinase XerD